MRVAAPRAEIFLVIEKACPYVNLRCRSCGQCFAAELISNSTDDYFEAILEKIPCDRF
jgi:hypothetical protein